jgi:hypothetical protein
MHQKDVQEALMGIGRILGVGRDGTRGAGAGARRWLFLLAAAAVVLACAEEPTGSLPDNLPPVTYLSVQGADSGTVLDTVSYAQALRWWGTDSDGEIVGYLIRWDSGWQPPAEAERWSVDSSWIVTAATADTFVLAVNGTYAEHVFSVRALDDDGDVDPAGRTQRFRLGNRLPTIEWNLRPSAQTLPAAAFGWKATDPDGPRTLSHYLYWLTRVTPPAVSDTVSVEEATIAISPTAFGLAGQRAGDWTMHAVAVDEAGGRSNEIIHTWNVKEPVGEYLLFDCLNTRTSGFRTDDEFFRAMMDTTVAGNYEIWEVETATDGFRHEVEVYPLLSLFRGVVWYGGIQDPDNDGNIFRNLQVAEASGGLRRYLQEGGRLLLCAHNAVGDSAALSTDFSQQVLGIAEFFERRGTPNVDLPLSSVVQTSLPGQTDSLKFTSSILGAELFLADPDVTPLFRVPPGFLRQAYPGPLDAITPDQGDQPAILGVLSSRVGTMGLTTFNPARANGFSNRNRIFAALFARVLLD